MSVSCLSPSAQNYLKVIFSAPDWTSEPITTTRIASTLGLKTSTVSDALRKLAVQGLVEHAPYGSIQLTETGRLYAVAMVRRHRLIETFLVNQLGYTWDEVHDEAETLEHAVSDLMVDRVDALLNHPTHDPHGDPIPDADGKMPPGNGTQLNHLPPGTRAVLVRVNDDVPDLLRYLSEAGLTVGDTVEIVSVNRFAETIDIKYDGDRQLSFGPNVIEALRVEPLADEPVHEDAQP